jgi:hypothetical protein
MELELLFIFFRDLQQGWYKTPFTKSLLPIIYQYYANG